MFAAAFSSFERGLQANPTEASLWVAFAMTAAEAGDLDKARQVSSDGAESCPNAGGVWMEWGLLEAQTGNRTQARTLFATALSLSPPHSPAAAAWAQLEKAAENEGASAVLQDLYCDLVRARGVGSKLGSVARPRGSPRALSWGAR